MSKLSKIAVFASVTVTVLCASCARDPEKLRAGYLKSGERYFTAGKYSEAAIEFRNAASVDPRRPESLYWLGRTYLALNNPEGAYRALTDAVALDPQHLEAQLQLATLLIGRGQFERADASLKLVLQVDPGNARAHAIQGQRYVVSGDASKAVQKFQAAIELDPQRVEYYSALASMHLSEGRIAEGEAVHKKAVAAVPTSPEAHLALGRFYFSQGRLSEAEAEMKAAIRLDPRAIHPRLFLARILTAAARPAEAETVCVDLKKMAPNDQTAYRALAHFYLSTGQVEKALFEFQSLVAGKPNDSAVKLGLVETLLDLNRVTEAARLNQELLRADAGRPEALLLQGRILLAQRGYEDAAGVLQRCLKNNPRLAACHYYLGLAQKALGLPDMARGSLEQALKLDPTRVDATVALAALSVRRGDPEALPLATRALAAQPDLPSAHIVNARALIAEGSLSRGEAALHQALKTEPASLPALAILLNLAATQGRAAEVVQRIATLSGQDPQNAGLHFLLGLGYFHLKDLNRSEASVRQALALDPATPSAYSLLANIDFARGSVESAKRNLERAIEANPRQVANLVALATQYEKEGNWDAARKLFEQARAVDPSAPGIAAELAYLHLEHGGDVNVAVSLAQTVKQRMPQSAMASDVLGWAYHKLGSTAAAITELQEAVRLAPGNAMYQYHLGMAYAGARQAESARRHLEGALRNDPRSPYATQIRAALVNLSQQPAPH